MADLSIKKNIYLLKKANKGIPVSVQGNREIHERKI